MEFVLSLFALFAVCAGESYWQLQLSPESVGSVPFGSSHISVWEHATSKGRYYALPIVCLQSDSALVIDNVFSRKTELEFEVLLWSREARKTVHNFLTSHINASIVEEQIELLPMERIRIVWKGDPLPDFYQLADQWRSNTHLPTVVTFSVTCQNNERCQELENAVRTRPSTFKHLEMEYEINSQRSARRRLTVEGRHLVGGSLYASLKSMPVTSPIRYLRSADVRRLTAETLTNVISSQVTDHDYVDTDDEISMTDLLQRVFDQTKVSTADFQSAMWQYLYWNPDNARPDKITSYMNRIFSRDAANSSNLSINQSQRSATAEAGYPIFFALFSSTGQAGSSPRSSVRKEDVLQSLRERDIAVQWSGERFVPKPLQLSRLNLATLNASTNIATSHVQIKRHDSIQSIKLRVDCDVNQTSRLTELIQARVERFINKTETEQNELAVVIQSEQRKLAGVLQDGLGRLAAALQTQSNRFEAALQTQNDRLEATLQTQISRLGVASQTQNDRLEATLQTQSNRFEAALQTQNDTFEATLQTQISRLGVASQTQNDRLEATLQTQINRFEAALQTQNDRLEATLQTQTSDLEAALRTQNNRNRLIETMAAGQQTMIGLQALGIITSHMRSPVPNQGYCYRPDHYCYTAASSVIVRHGSVSRQRLKTLCDEDAACQAFNDYTDDTIEGGRIYRQIVCPPASFRSDSGTRYYVKIAPTPVNIKRKLSEIVQSSSLNSTIQTLVSRLQSVYDEFCKRQFGDEYRYEN